MNKYKEFLKQEKRIYLNRGFKRNTFDFLTKESNYIIYKFVKYLRKEELHYSKMRGFFKLFHFLLFILCRRKKNKLGFKLGFFVPMNTCDLGLTIYHYGEIIINNSCHIGKNLKLHGNNCIGNDGIDINSAPRLGDNVELGFGASIIGNVKIGNNVTIGAGAVVVNSFEEDNITLIGCPARKIK